MSKDNKTHPRRKTLYRVKNWSEYDSLDATRLDHVLAVE